MRQNISQVKPLHDLDNVAKYEQKPVQIKYCHDGCWRAVILTPKSPVLLSEVTTVLISCNETQRQQTETDSELKEC